MHMLQTLLRRYGPLAAAFLAAVSFAATAQPVEVVEGKQYLRLKAPQPVESGKKIEVIEFFSYGCPHCGELEPFLQSWLKALPPDVQFRRVPVVFQDRWAALAKEYYTLDALGEESRLTPEIFAALHGKGLPMWQDKTFFDWAASQGLDRKKVEDMYNSFAIASKFNRGKATAQAYQIQEVPKFVVDGRYVTHNVGTHRAMPGVLDALIAKARAERPKN